MRRVISVATLAATMLVTTAGPAVADDHVPDPAASYSYLGGVQAELTGPGQSPPGANDRSCRPTAAHPNPVVLIHGLSNDTISWNTLSPVLADAGYCVYTTTYGSEGLGPIGATAPIQDSATQIGNFIDRVEAATGVKQVDLVSHSIGGAVAYYYLSRLGGASKIGRYVALAAPLHGSTVSGLAGVQPLVESTGSGAAATRHCGPCQLSPGAPFLQDLEPKPDATPAIPFTMIVTRYDQIATPYTTGLLDGPNVHNVVLQDLCPTDFTEHNELTSDPVAIHEVLDALDPAHATPPTCTIVLPLLGPPSR
ncbi:esterase/lipase family protein [Nocardia africana]|uniref:Extracellular esterase estB n=2 Tax=Nocardia africana TaxID=134964 RepID=A0A378WVK6_9NOCA|nr:alpha/beta fold hydrolase [Nocardia africana]MCC3313734.1 alpha/beta fold hydrolase [Nocardia africana]SUA44882.1 Extracellular esterase estB precursor [Nocardia africana]